MKTIHTALFQHTNKSLYVAFDKLYQFTQPMIHNGKYRERQINSKVKNQFLLPEIV